MDIKHLVSRQDGIEVVYRDSQLAIDFELREVKEKQDFLSLVSHNSRVFVGFEMVIYPETKFYSVVVVVFDFSEPLSARKKGLT